MVIHEGSRRLHVVGKLLVFFGLAAGLLGTILVSASHALQALNLGGIVVMTFLASEVVGGALWFLGRTLDGFTGPQPTGANESR